MGKVDSVKLELTKGRSDLAILTEEQLSWLNKAKRFADAVPLSEVIKSDNENLFLRDLFESACKEEIFVITFYHFA